MLTVFFIVILALILLLTVFLVTPLQFGLEYVKNADADRKCVLIRIFGIPFKIRLKPPKDYSLYKDLYYASKGKRKKIYLYAKRHLSVELVDFNVRFGFKDAATTGMSNGAIWGICCSLLSLIDSLFGIKKINLQINPDFCNKVFEFYLKTILIMKPIHIIIMLGSLVKTYIMLKRK